MNNQSIQFATDIYLTSQAAIFLYAFGQLQHRLFHRVAFTGFILPLGGDKNVTGCAGTGTTTIGVNAGNGVIDCIHHDRLALHRFNLMFCSVVLYIGDAYHFDSPFFVIGSYDFIPWRPKRY
ncbi:MAG: hypothetical protein ACI9GB_002249, partial [Halioglobus sp.]